MGCFKRIDRPLIESEVMALYLAINRYRTKPAAMDRA